MKDKIILAPDVNESELLRAMARWGNHAFSMGTRVMNGAALAEKALICSGIPLPGLLMTRRESVAITYEIIQEIGAEDAYFSAAKTRGDAGNIVSAMIMLRGLIPAALASQEEEVLQAWLKDERQQVFARKNQALIEYYHAYRKRCREKQMIDATDLIRLALEKAAPMEAELFILEEFPPSPLDTALIEKLSGGSYGTLSLQQLLGGDADQETPDISYTSCYGAVNEIEQIIEQIYRTEGCRLDDCLVAVAGDASYIQSWMDIAAQYGVPISFGQGVPLSNSFPGHFLDLLAAWAGRGHYGVEAMKALLHSPSLDGNAMKKLLDEDWWKYRDDTALMAGQLRISLDAEKNRIRLQGLKEVIMKKAEAVEAGAHIKKEEKRALDKDLICLSYVEKLTAALEEGLTSFFEKYCRGRKAPPLHRIMDTKAKKLILEELAHWEETWQNSREKDWENIVQTLEDLCRHLLGRSVMKAVSMPGQLHITTIPGAMASLRKRLFICGLSADSFPGNPVENYLVLDKELAFFGQDGARYRSDQKVIRKKEEMAMLLKLAASRQVPVSLSWSNFNLAELKKANPSSVLFELYEAEHPGAELKAFVDAAGKKDFRNNSLSLSSFVLRGHTEGIKVNPIECKREALPEEEKKKLAEELLEREWSPSRLGIFNQCPRHFAMQYIYGIPGQEEDDILKPMLNNTVGNMAHDLLEALGGAGPENISAKDFEEMARQAIADHFKRRIPLNEKDRERETETFIRLMNQCYAWEKELGRSVEEAEEDWHGTVAGVKLKGYPDRLEKDQDGKYIITDFKSGKWVTHKENDLDSCLQAIIYARLAEAKGYAIDHCEFRYLRQREIISCRYDEAMKAGLTDFLKHFKKSLKKLDFPSRPDGSFLKPPKKELADAPKCKNCGFCPYKDLCETYMIWGKAK